MDQDPTPAPPPTEGKPGVFNKLNGTIAGITGLVIALGGLAATWDRIFPNKQAEAAVPAQQAAEAEAVPVDETAAAATTEEAEPEAGAPTSYSGKKVDGGEALTIEWDGKNWILTEGDDSWTYDELTPENEANYEAVSNGNYLRWPIAGGEVDESRNRKKWETYGDVRPVAEPAPTE